MRLPLSAQAAAALFVVAMLAPGVASVPAPVTAPSERTQPGLLFDQDDVVRIKQRAKHPKLAPVTQSLLTRADALLSAAPIVPSVTMRGEPDSPGETKGIASARRLQGRVFTWAMAYTLTGEQKYRDAEALGVPLHAVVATYEDYDLGRNAWDLIVMAYVRRIRAEDAARLRRALKPGGLLVYENNNVSETKNDLLRSVLNFRIVWFEDTTGKADWNPDRQSRIERLIAETPVN